MLSFIGMHRKWIIVAACGAIILMQIAAKSILVAVVLSLLAVLWAVFLTQFDDRKE